MNVSKNEDSKKDTFYIFQSKFFLWIGLFCISLLTPLRNTSLESLWDQMIVHQGHGKHEEELSTIFI